MQTGSCLFTVDSQLLPTAIKLIELFSSINVVSKWPKNHIRRDLALACNISNLRLLGTLSLRPQNESFSANCKIRGSAADVSLPTDVVPSKFCGGPKFTLLNTLKNSARN